MLATLQVISYRTTTSYITTILKDLRYRAILDPPVLAGNTSDNGYNDNNNSNDDNDNDNNNSSSNSDNNNKGSNKTKL